LRKNSRSEQRKSNQNWTVYDNVPCKYCGGKLKIKIEDDDERVKGELKSVSIGYTSKVDQS
jgi:hypothetical protein